MFFLSGGQIDGQGNINLVGVGDYAQPKARFPGSFGSAYLYYVVPKVILFRTEHSRRTLVPKVDFISAPGGSAQRVSPRRPDRAGHQPLPVRFRPRARRFRLASVHPGHSVAEVIENTGFEFDRPPDVPVTPAPSAETLRLMRAVVAPMLAEVYPQFAAQVFGEGSDQPAIFEVPERRRRSPRGRRRALHIPPRMVFMLPTQIEETLRCKTVEAAVIGAGWCGGMRAETLSRTALVEKLHICEIRPDRLAEVKALYKPATATLDYQDIISNDNISRRLHLDHAGSQPLSDRARLPEGRQARDAGKADRAGTVGGRRADPCWRGATT